MTDYGVLPDGSFRRKPLEAILEEIGAFQLASISTNLDLAPGSPQYHINMSFARQCDQVWAILADLHVLDPDQLTGPRLEMISKLTMTARRGEDYSHVTLQCEIEIPAGADKVSLVSGTHHASVAGNPESQWTPIEDFTATEDGTFDVVFRSAERGAFSAPAGTVTVITTTVTGWVGVTNSDDATEGHPVDDDPALRVRREADLARAGGGTLRAIPIDVSTVENVLSAIAYQNKLDWHVDGIPAHAVEVVVDDGQSPTADDDEIAQAILDTVGAGVNIIGRGSSGAAVDAGLPTTIPFTRVAYRQTHFAYELEVDPETYPGDTAFKALIRAAVLLNFGHVGATVIALRCQALALSVPGVRDVVSFALGFSDAPTLDDNLQLGPRERVSLDVGDIDVTTT